MEETFLEEQFHQRNQSPYLYHFSHHVFSAGFEISQNWNSPPDLGKIIDRKLNISRMGHR